MADPALHRDFTPWPHRHYLESAPDAPGADCDGRVKPTWARIDPPGSDGGGCKLFHCVLCGKVFAVGALKGDPPGTSRVVAVYEPTWRPGS